MLLLLLVEIETSLTLTLTLTLLWMFFLLIVAVPIGRSRRQRGKKAGGGEIMIPRTRHEGIARFCSRREWRLRKIIGIGIDSVQIGGSFDSKDVNPRDLENEDHQKGPCRASVEDGIRSFRNATAAVAIPSPQFTINDWVLGGSLESDFGGVVLSDPNLGTKIAMTFLRWRWMLLTHISSGGNTERHVSMTAVSFAS